MPLSIDFQAAGANCNDRWPPPAAWLVAISLRSNSSSSLFFSLHICAARLLPLRLWLGVWTSEFRLVHLKHLPLNPGTVLSREHAVHFSHCDNKHLFSTFELRQFPRFISLAVNFAKKFPKRYHHRDTLEHALHTRRLSIRSTAPLAFYSLYPCLVARATSTRVARRASPSAMFVQAPPSGGFSMEI